MWETKRIFSKKITIFLMLLLVVNTVVFAYVQFSGKSFAQMKKENDIYNEYVDRFSKQDLETAKETVKKEYSDARMYRKVLLEENNTTKLAEHSQVQSVLKSINEKLDYLTGFHSNVNNVIENAEKMQKFSLFANKSSFAYNNIIRTGADFERIKDIQLTFDNDRAVEAFINYYFMYYLVMAFMITIIYTIFLERENGMWQLVHSSKEGRIRVAIKRIVLIIASSYLILAVFYVTTAVEAFAIYGGLSGLNKPIQTIISFGSFTHAYSRFQYMWMLYLFSGLIIGGLSLLLWMVFTIFRNRNHTLVAVAVVIGVEILLYQKIAIQSIYSAFHHINIVSFLKFNELYRGYLNWGFGQYVFPVVSIIIFALFITIIVSGVAGVLRYENMMPSGKVSVITKIAGKINEGYQRIFQKLPVCIKELHKLIFTGHGVWVVVFVIVIAIYFSTNGTMTFTDAAKERDNIYQCHGGQNYEEIENMITQAQTNYRDAIQQLGQAEQSFKLGEMDISTYYDYSSTVDYYTQELGKLKEFIAKQAYIDELSESGISAWMISDRGYEEIFGEKSDQRELIILIALVTGVMFIVSESVSMEYRNGMNEIIRSGKRGRKWILAQKIIACTIFVIGLTVVVYGIDLMNMVRIYGMPYTEAPLISLTFMKDVVCGNGGGILSRFVIGLYGTAITIKDWMAVRVAVRALIALITMALAIITSRAIGRKNNRVIMLGVLASILISILLLRSSCGVL